MPALAAASVAAGRCLTGRSAAAVDASRPAKRETGMALPGNIPCEAIMESLADGVFTVDTDWKITFFNRAAGDVAGIAPAKALGRKCWEVFHSSLCDGACALRACIDGDKTLANQAIFIERPDGTKVAWKRFATSRT